MAHLVEVALPLPLFRRFTYEVRDGAIPPPGTRVLVPFHRSERVGWVVGPAPNEEVPGLRPVLSVLDERPSVPHDLLDLARWMAGYYVAPEGIVLRAVLPSALSDPARETLTLEAEAGDGHASLTPRETRLVEALRSRSGPARVRPLRRSLDMGSLWPEIRSLQGKGLLRHETLRPEDPPVKTRRVVRVRRWLTDLGERDASLGRAHRQRECYELLESSGGERELAELLEVGGFSRSVVKGLEEKGVVELVDREEYRDPFRDLEPEEPPRLRPNPHQEAAIQALIGELDGAKPRPHLLHGITGSGKTLVYLELLREVVERRGRTAIVLVPEISLTPQTVRRFHAWFGDRIAVLHSALSQGERYDAWRQLRNGEKEIAVGARSAIFAPLERLGAIVVDEEHDGSYKQSEAPRYQARDVAVMRAASVGALCVLGSATPSLESWENVRRGKFVRLSLPNRATGGPLPPVEAVDLRRVRKEVGGEVILSPVLVREVRDRLERREQSILLLNRRGFSSFVQCRDCGEVVECPHCSVSLTHHKLRRRILCHHCRYEEGVPSRCPRCGSGELSFRGMGTERVENAVAETFPSARIARMDVDTTSGKWAHHEILGRVERGEVDILMGTQMIAKGLDFPKVTLVGVVDADVGLHLPDFRSSERTFQLLAQVSGRTGRGPLGGRVLVQTSLPEHYAVQAAMGHDYEAFAGRELDERTVPPYPPHVRLANVITSSPDQSLAADAAREAVEWIRKARARGGDQEEVEVVGPAPAPIERLHRRWRWHFFLRARTPGPLGALCRSFAAGFTPRGGGDVRVIVDRDPGALL